MSTSYLLKPRTFNGTLNKYQVLYTGKDHNNNDVENADVEQIWYKTYTDSDWTVYTSQPIRATTTIPSGADVKIALNSAAVMDFDFASYDVKDVSITEVPGVSSISYDPDSWTISLHTTAMFSSGSIMGYVTFARRAYTITCVWQKPFRLFIGSDSWANNNNTATGTQTANLKNYQGSNVWSGQLVYSGGINPQYFPTSPNGYYLYKKNNMGQWSEQSSFMNIFPRTKQYQHGSEIDWDFKFDDGPIPNEQYFFTSLGGGEQDWACYLSLTIPKGQTSANIVIPYSASDQTYRFFSINPDGGWFEVFDVNNYCNSETIEANVTTTSNPQGFRVTVQFADGHVARADTKVVGKLWWYKTLTIPASGGASSTSITITRPFNSSQRATSVSVYFASNPGGNTSRDRLSSSNAGNTTTITYQITYQPGAQGATAKARMTFHWSSPTSYEPLKTAKVPTPTQVYFSYSSDGQDAELETEINAELPYAVYAYWSHLAGSQAIHDNPNECLAHVGLESHLVDGVYYGDYLYFADTFSESHTTVTTTGNLYDKAGLMLPSDTYTETYSV